MIPCEYLAQPEEITEFEPMFSDGSEYLVRVVFREDDKAWGQYMLAKTKDLAPYLFAEEATT